MLSDVVVDTNVLIHASNPSVAYNAASLALLVALQNASTALCVDPGFDVNEAQNRSLIAGEYQQKLPIGSLGFAVVATLAATGRVKQVSRKVPEALARKIRHRVGKPRDRTFVHVAANSNDRRLVSHDFEDFSDDTRMALSPVVTIQTANEALPDLT